MKEELTSLKTSILAKEKGFNVEVKAYFDLKKFGKKPVELFGKLDVNNLTKWNNDLKQNVPAGYISNPTQSLLQKWLREIHKIHITIQRVVGNRGTDEETETWTFKGTPWETYPTYEDALEEALIEALNSIPNK